MSHVVCLNARERRSGPSVRGWLVPAFVVFICGTTAAPAIAQTVQGVVVLAESDTPLPGALVDLIAVDPDVDHDDDEIEADKDGAFAISVPKAGSYVLRVRLLGYRPQFAVLSLSGGQTIAIRVNMAPVAVALDAVTVYGLEANTPGQQEFWSRRDLDWSFSYDYTQFEEMGAHTIGDVLRFGLPGGKLPYCAIVYRDGWKIGTYQMNSFPLGWVYGIEIFLTKYDIPIRYRDPFEDRPCGAVLIWTREVGDGRPTQHN